MTAAEIANSVKLESVCPKCDGTGGKHDEGWIACWFCKGTGYIPTEVGEKIIDLIRHNLRGIKEK